MSVDDKRQRRRYTHQPMFRSHLRDIDVVVAGLGEINNKMRTVGIWVDSRRHGGAHTNTKTEGAGSAEMDFQRGVVYYLEDNK
jgi:hypothetical protein